MVYINFKVTAKRQQITILLLVYEQILRQQVATRSSQEVE